MQTATTANKFKSNTLPDLCLSFELADHEAEEGTPVSAYRPVDVTEGEYGEFQIRMAEWFGG